MGLGFLHSRLLRITMVVARYCEVLDGRMTDEGL